MGEKEPEGKSFCLLYGCFLLPLFSTQHFSLVLQISLESVNFQYFTWMWEGHWHCYAEWRRNPHFTYSGRATFRELRKLEWSHCRELWRIWDLPSFQAYKWACHSSMDAGKRCKTPWTEAKDIITHSNSIDICTSSPSPNSYRGTQREPGNTWTGSELR